jgi:hypothetical protein
MAKKTADAVFFAGSKGSEGSEGSEGFGIACGDEYIASVTIFTLVSQVLHDEEEKPPSFGRGVSPQATEDSRPFKERPRPFQGLI